MAFKIGFLAEHPEPAPAERAPAVPRAQAEPRRSLVQIHFSERNMTLAYYNDRFDLHRGDLVYVDGKLEGLLGRVVEVNYCFKIKASDYKRVIAVADTSVTGRFFMAGSHFVTFDRAALPREKAALWFRAPEKEDDEFLSGSDGGTFGLHDLGGMKISAAAAERGHDYYRENRVRYLCVDGERGYAIVEGSHAYEVEFTYFSGGKEDAGMIGGLVCSCFCAGACKHEFAAMLQLRETLELICRNYQDEYGRTGYFAAVNKGTLFSFAVDGRETGSFTL